MIQEISPHFPTIDPPDLLKVPHEAELGLLRAHTQSATKTLDPGAQICPWQLRGCAGNIYAETSYLHDGYNGS